MFKRAMKDTRTPKNNKNNSSISFILKTTLISGFIVAAGVIMLFIYFNYQPSSSTVQPTTMTSLPSLKEEPLPIQPSTMDRVKLFFTKDGLHLTQQVIEMGSNLTDYEKIHFIIENLERGPIASSLRPVIPGNCKLANIYILKDKVVLNVECQQSRPRFGSITDEMLCVYSIVNSIIANYNKVNAVQILINGKINKTFGDFVDIHSPLVPNQSLIK